MILILVLLGQINPLEWNSIQKCMSGPVPIMECSQYTSVITYTGKPPKTVIDKPWCRINWNRSFVHPVCLQYDYNKDLRIDMLDWQLYQFIPSNNQKILRITFQALMHLCITGPGTPAPPGCRDRFDLDKDGDVDLEDVQLNQLELS